MRKFIASAFIALALTASALAAGSLTLLKAGSAGVGVPTTLTFSATGNSTSGATVTIPAGAAVGDLCILGQGSLDSTGPLPTAVTPTNWTNAATTTGTTIIRGMLDYKVLVGGDPGTSITGMNASDGNNKMIVCFTPNAPITSVSVVSPNQEATTGDPVLQTITAAGQPTPLVEVGHMFQTSGIGTPSGTLVTNGSSQTTANNRMYYEVFNSSPASRTIDTTDSGANVMESAAFVVS